MVRKQWPRISIIAGLIILSLAGAAAYIKLDTELKFADLTSGNPRWDRPLVTGFDLLILRLPIDAVASIGAILLVIGYTVLRWRKHRHTQRDNATQR